VPELDDLALEVRAKNAGPFWLTLDVFLRDDAAYRAADELITTELIADLYHVAASAIAIFRLPGLRVIKASLPRPVTQGSLRDRDIHAGQQHVPLATVRMPGR
jgi:Domain of unknown function (DUF4387)